MWNFLKRWLGWEEEQDYFNPDDFKPRGRPKSATAQVLASAPRKASPPRSRTATPKPKTSAAADTLNLDDTPDAPPQFDPYNTGKFDRSASWERISKKQR